MSVKKNFDETTLSGNLPRPETTDPSVFKSLAKSQRKKRNFREINIIRSVSNLR